MGGIVSVLPEKLTELQVKNLSGNQFDQLQFDSLKDEEGKIKKDQLLSILLTHEERARERFLVYCNPSTEMDLAIFLGMCKDTDIIDLQLRAIDAQEIFESARSKQSNFSRNITFEVFIRYAIPDIATKKMMTQVDVLSNIYKAPPPSPIRRLAESFQGSDSLIVNTLTNDPASRRGSVQRRSSVGPGTYIDFNAPGENEGQVQFILFCPDGEMGVDLCVKICKDVGLLDEKLTSIDIEGIFQQAKAYVTQKQGFPAKSIKYTTFRHVCIPAIAAKKEMKDLDVLLIIGKGNGPITEVVAPTEPLPGDGNENLQNKLSIDTEPEVVGANDALNSNLIGLPSNGQLPNDGLSGFEDPNDNEVKLKFNCICPDGSMDVAKFVTFCEETGLVNEEFKPEDAEVAYEVGRAHISQRLSSPAKFIRYHVFRRICLPNVAIKKSVTEAELVNIICATTETAADVANIAALIDHQQSSETPDTGAKKGTVRRKSAAGGERSGTRSSIRKASLTGTVSDKKPSTARRKSLADSTLLGQPADATPPAVRRKSLTGMGPGASHSDSVLARSLQSRAGDIRRQSSNLSDEGALATKRPPLDRRASRRLSASATATATEAVKVEEEPFIPSEHQVNCVKAVFLKYATLPEEEMTAAQFIKLMREVQIFTKTFTTIEAEIVYMECKEKAQKPGCLYPVTTSNHMSFDMFYYLCVPVIAKKREESVEALITTFTSREDILKALMLS